MAGLGLRPVSDTSDRPGQLPSLSPSSDPPKHSSAQQPTHGFAASGPAQQQAGSEASLRLAYLETSLTRETGCWPEASLRHVGQT